MAIAFLFSILLNGFVPSSLKTISGSALHEVHKPTDMGA